ncbi:hypothetical protein [Clostridium sp. AF22-10]|jgi:hypothetical protein|uniref:hypothetical protein n=1 Tax=Clostridium sp. AF22-10 TaxID=2293004 RepID=UPI000E5041ED|nr:hypothetical protein DWX91_15520 [Clostridium sp. AF22-10]DAO90182.1 MAG TPA: hypothetical protein [Caudoviricetes sp.]DAX13432.1 MAG TPA: hypothetical protein [Bacteriophage sp.]
MKVKSNLKPRSYTQNEVVRIVNQKQYLTYIKNGVYPIDMYASIDEKTDNTILAMIFLKEDTSEVYKKWCNYELN